MSISSIHPQECYLYDYLWNAKMDTELLDMLLEQREAVYSKPMYQSPHVLQVVLGTLNQKYGNRLSLCDVEERISFLEGRYSTFTHLMALEKTHWDQKSNCITTAEVVWLEIIKENEFAQEYYYDGEPEYKKLGMIFGKAAIKTKASHTVIVISDSITQKVQEVLPKEISSDDDVTSHLMLNTTKTRRRLFHDEDDAESVIRAENIEPRPNNWNYPPRNPFPTNRKTVGGAKDFDGSSCTSCSPFK